MTDRIKNSLKEAFNGIHADTEIKTKTKVFVAEKLSEKENRRKFNTTRFASVALCALLALTGGGSWLYFTPTAAVSIDINPSLELSVNRFDKVVAVKGYNDSGEEISSSLDVKFMDCDKAVEQILKNEAISSKLSDDGLLTLAVSSDNENQSAKLKCQLEECTRQHKNARCYTSTTKQAKNAHENGLSHGKYIVFLELQALDETLTVQDVEDMTMREMNDLLDVLSGKATPDDCTSNGQCNGNGNGNGNGQGNGNGNGKNK